jgi:hypothetical protein
LEQDIGRSHCGAKLPFRQLAEWQVVSQFEIGKRFRYQVRGIQLVPGMAILFFGRTRCALCNEILNQGDDIVATSHFIGDPNDALWRFSDAGMHRSCFSTWDLRMRFVDKFNEIVGPMTWGDRSYKFMAEDGTVHRMIRPNP